MHCFVAFLPFYSSWVKDVVFHSAIIIGLAAVMDSGLLLPGNRIQYLRAIVVVSYFF